MTTTSYVTLDAIREHLAAAAEAAVWQRTSTNALVDGTQIDAEAMLVSARISNCSEPSRFSAAAFLRKTMCRLPGYRGGLELCVLEGNVRGRP